MIKNYKYLGILNENRQNQSVNHKKNVVVQQIQNYNTDLRNKIRSNN